VYDDAQRRLTIVGPALRVVRAVPFGTSFTVPAAMQARIPRMYMGRPVSLRRGGAYAALLFPSAIQPVGLPAAGVYLAEMDSSGLIGAIRASVQGTTSSVSVPNGACPTCRASMPIPFAPKTLYAASPTGSRFAVVSTSINGPRTKLHIVVVNPAGGDTIYSRSIDYVSERIPERVRDSTLQRITSRVQAGTISMGKELLAILRARGGIPQFYPVVSAVVVATDGSLALELRPSATESRYLLLDPGGAERGIVTLPLRASVIASDGTLYWTSEMDSDGFFSVVRYRRR
jgi:hypothetical protein